MPLCVLLIFNMTAGAKALSPYELRIAPSPHAHAVMY
jgi:hypothetical protein